MGALFERLLPLAPDERFDAMLAWDVFDYMRPDQVSALMARLTPACRPEAPCWSWPRRERQIPAAPLRYRILDRENLAVRRPARAPARRPVPRAARPAAHDARLLGPAQRPAAQRRPGVPVRPWGGRRVGPGRGGERRPGRSLASPLVSAGAALTSAALRRSAGLRPPRSPPEVELREAEPGCPLSAVVGSQEDLRAQRRGDGHDHGNGERASMRPSHDTTTV